MIDLTFFNLGIGIAFFGSRLEDLLDYICVTKMDVRGLAAEWDSFSSIRDRLRVGRKLFEHPATQKWCEPTRENCVRNSDALAPILNRLQTTVGRTLPHLDPLQNEVKKLYAKVGATPGDKIVYTTSVEIKKLAGFIKRRANPARQEFTKDRVSKYS